MNNDLQLSPPRTPDEFAARIRHIKSFEQEYKFRLGEFLQQSKDRLGDEIFWQYVHGLERDYQDIQNLMHIYRAVKDQYTPAIKYDLWRDLAAFTPEEREPLIVKLLRNEMNRDDVRALRKAQRNGNGTNHDPQPENAANGRYVQLGWHLAAAAKAIRADNAVALKSAMDELIAEWLKMEGGDNGGDGT